MKKFVVLLVGICFISCATTVPKQKIVVSDLSSEKNELVNLLDRNVNNVKIKENAKSIITVAFPMWDQLYLYKQDLKYNLNQNKKNDSDITFWNYMIGAVGGFSGISVIFNDYAVAIPVAIGLWEVIAGTIQSKNLKPYIDRVQNEINYIENIKKSSDELNIKLFSILTSTDTKKINENVSMWISEALLQYKNTKTILDNSEFFILDKNRETGMDEIDILMREYNI